MVFEFIPDLGEEIIQKLNKINQGIENMKQKLSEKDKRILKLEAKLREYRNGS